MNQRKIPLEQRAAADVCDAFGADRGGGQRGRDGIRTLALLFELSWR